MRQGTPRGRVPPPPMPPPTLCPYVPEGPRRVTSRGASPAPLQSTVKVWGTRALTLGPSPGPEHLTLLGSTTSFTGTRKGLPVVEGAAQRRQGMGWGWGQHGHGGTVAVGSTQPRGQQGQCGHGVNRGMGTGTAQGQHEYGDSTGTESVWAQHGVSVSMESACPWGHQGHSHGGGTRTEFSMSLRSVCAQAQHGVNGDTGTPKP